MASDWFSSQLNLYQGMSERALLIVKYAQAQRMEKEKAAVDAKYDGSAAAAIEDQINKLGDEKLGVSQWLSNVQNGQKRFQNVREYMLQMKAALKVSSPSPAAFDNYFDAQNSLLANEKYNKDSVISNNTNSRGSWRDTTEVVSSGVMSAEITHHYIGNDYAIELDGGAGILTSNSRTGVLSGAGREIKRADLKLVSMTGDQVEFQDMTDPANPVTLTGTVKRGGLGVLPSWLYGDLSVPENVDRANADLAAGFKKMARIELDFNIDQAQLSTMSSSLTSKMQNLQKDYDRVANEEVDAKLAEKKAIQSRFDIYNNSLALTSARSADYIQQMFNTALPTKQSFGDALLSANGY